MLAKDYQEEGRMDCKEQNAPKTYRRSLLRIAVGLIFAIAVLGTVQWATAFRGDLLWILMVAMGFVFVGALLQLLPGRPITAGQWKDTKSLFGRDSDWPHYNDPSNLGSPLNRSPFDKEG
jgi:hypothetical protein